MNLNRREDDARVLAWLRERGPVTVTVKQAALGTTLPRCTVRASLAALGDQGLVCLMYDAGDDAYLVRHIHADPGPCDESLGVTVREVYPDW